LKYRAIRGPLNRTLAFPKRGANGG